MVRGSISLFKDMQQELPKTEIRKGRSSILNAKRNECLVDRYCFYCLTTKFKYEYIIEIIAKEFFISIHTVPEVLAANNDYRKQVRKEQPIKSVFTKKWPHMAW